MPSAVLVGDHPLLMTCAARLGEAGFDVVAVSTDDPSLTQWVADEEIAAVEWAGLASWVAEARPDVLISVGNLRILSNEILAAVGTAVNFHDGPLPERAGLHSPVWALLEGAAEHGIAWHVVEHGIDEGDILAERRFELAPDETTRSLNIACFAAASEAFDEVVAQLASGRLDRRAQDEAHHRVHLRYDRPPAANSLLVHQHGAVELDRLVRSLDFGPTLNRMGRPVLAIGDGLMMVTAAQVLETTELAPGAIGRAEPGGNGALDLVVGTADGDLGLAGFVDRRVDTTSLTGATVPDVAPLVDALTERHRAVVRHEAAWAATLADHCPVELPFTAADADASAASDRLVLATESWTEAAALVALHALRRCGVVEATVDLLPPGDIDDLDRWFTSVLPVNVAHADGQSVGDALAAVATRLKAATERGSRLRDLPSRMPEQVDQPPETPPAAISIGTADGDRPGAVHVALEANGDDTVAATVHLRGATPADARRWADSLATFAEGLDDPERPLSAVSHLAPDERALALNDIRRPAEEHPGSLHGRFHAVALQYPDHPAVAHGDVTLSYSELDVAARRVAAGLVARGVEPGDFVGVAAEPGVHVLAGVLGVLMAGAAYVPLDPRFPAERIEHMVSDAGMRLALVDDPRRLSGRDGLTTALLVELATDDATEPLAAPVDTADDALAYVMYTSGSTGLPKGVKVEHRNVLSFLAAMEEHVDHEPGEGVWLSVTTLSFDISVLELFHPLLHGWKVVLYEGLGAVARASAATASDLEMSIFFFGSGDTATSYELMLESARFADEHDLAAVWTPERHFHAFGGPFPNPSVTAAAMAAITERIQVRAGSCVLPLHHPVRVAEEWAVVDNLSKGRVGIAIAAGWHPDDFVLRPANHGQSKDALFEQIDQVRRLWRGEHVVFDGPAGPVDVHTLPRPVQAELPMWYTTAGNPASFELAGRHGMHLLTHLLGQRMSDVEANVARYRAAWQEAGHPGRGQVALMLHTYIGEDLDSVREIVREPMKSYLGDSVGLIKDVASSFPTFDQDASFDDALEALSPEDLDALLEVAFLRYFETAGLFGSVDDAAAFARRVEAIDVDEIAALIDFGIDAERVRTALPALVEVREQFATPIEPTTYGSLIATHGVTHLQCTPSEARIILADPDSAAALGGLRQMLVGGEACPPSLAAELRSVLDGELINMYGPTETTIWSTAHRITDDDVASGSIPIGRPLDNTSVRLVAASGALTPIGAPGELLIGGDGVTAGYHDRAELTAERFVDIDGARMYRTGDLASWRADGTLAFHGRLDNQVKIRGHRVELGDIEAATASRPDVAEAVVVLEGDSDHPRLVAHVVPAAGPVDEHRVLDDLRLRLPSHMVPEHVVAHSVLPTTPNGKTDRLALARHQRSDTPAESSERPAPVVASIVAPSGGPASASGPGAGHTAAELGDIIAEVWGEVLGVADVSRSKSFFDHGGNSLQVVSVRERLQERLDHPISLVDLFRHPSVADLAAAYAAKQSPADGPTGGRVMVDAVVVPPTSADTDGGGQSRADRRAEARRRARGRR